MRLSRKKAIELCIELWTWLALTGKLKKDWPKWKKYKLVSPTTYCWFCIYDEQFMDDCDKCPLVPKYTGCSGTYFANWVSARFPRTRKKYAKLFLEQLLTIK